MPTHPLVQARVFDAAGHAVHVAGGDGSRAMLRWPDGTVLTIPNALLEKQEDGSLLLPFTLHDAGEGGVVRIPVLEERLQVTKHEVDSGGVRIRKSVQTRDEEIALGLASEQLHVERVAVGTVVQEEDMPRMREEGDTVVIPVLEEQIVVTKQLILKEELRVTRTRIERSETRTETLRVEHVEVERLEDGKPLPG